MLTRYTGSSQLLPNRHHRILQILTQCVALPNELVDMIKNYWIGPIVVYSNKYAFAFLMADGSIETCGHAGWGGDSKRVLSNIRSHGIKSVYFNNHTFIAKLLNDSVVHWGHPIHVTSKDLENVDTVTTNRFAFAIKKNDGGVITLGKIYNRRDIVRVKQIRKAKAIVASSEAFAVTFQDPHQGVVAWGDHKFGGMIDPFIQRRLKSKGVEYVIATTDAFAAFLVNGQGVEVWGRARYGGLLTIDQECFLKMRTVTGIYSTKFAFVATCADGTNLSWGNPRFGGDDHLVKTELNSGLFNEIVSTDYAFTAIMDDRRSMVSWGGSNMFGTPILLSDRIRTQVAAHGIYKIYTTSSAFVVILGNGELIAWGDIQLGGNIDHVQKEFKVDVETIVPNYGAFAAKLIDQKTVVVWGDPDCGGIMSHKIKNQIKTKGVVNIYATKCAFAATLSDGSVVTWGSHIYGGNSDHIYDTLRRGYCARD